MQCPYCQTPLQATASECPSCRLTYPRTVSLVGAMPRLTPSVADLAGLLQPGDHAKLIKRITALETTFPELVLQVVVHIFPDDHPFSMHAFWLFNAGNFAGNSCRGKLNRSILLAIDPKRTEAAIIPGYGLEPFLPPETLNHLLELASPEWAKQQWTAGILRAIDGLEQLLNLCAVPDEPEKKVVGEY
jgi:uncharacterized membrane protein YgcG